MSENHNNDKMCSWSETPPFQENCLNNDGDLHPRQKRLLDRITLSCQGGHQHHETGDSYHTLGIPFPEALARRFCRALMETTSGEEVFAFIAAAAGTRIDDHRMEVGVKETEEPATKKQRSQPESQHTEPDVSKKDLDFLNTAVVDIVHTRHWLERHIGREPSHSFSDMHETVSVHDVKKFRVDDLIQSQIWKSILPSGRTFRLTKQSGLSLQMALNTSFLSSLMKVVI